MSTIFVHVVQVSLHQYASIVSACWATIPVVWEQWSITLSSIFSSLLAGVSRKMEVRGCGADCQPVCVCVYALDAPLVSGWKLQKDSPFWTPLPGQSISPVSTCFIGLTQVHFDLLFYRNARV